MPTRPKNKTQMRQDDIVKEFVDKHPNYLVESIVGPTKISNFRGEEQSKGSWILKVVNTKSRKKPSLTKFKKATSKKEA